MAPTADTVRAARLVEHGKPVVIEAEERRPGLEAALEAVKAGELKVVIDAILRIDQVGEAFKRLVDRRVQGNLLLDLS